MPALSVDLGSVGTWTVGMTITVQCNPGTYTFDTTKQHNIVFYGPGGNSGTVSLLSTSKLKG